MASSDTFLRLLDELEAVKIAEEEASKSEALKVLCGWIFFGSQVEHQIAPATKAHSRRDLSFCFNLFSPSGPPTLIFQLFERSSQNFNVWLCQAREKDSRGEDPKGLPSYDPSAQ